MHEHKTLQYGESRAKAFVSGAEVLPSVEEVAELEDDSESQNQFNGNTKPFS